MCTFYCEPTYICVHATATLHAASLNCNVHVHVHLCVLLFQGKTPRNGPCVGWNQQTWSHTHFHFMDWYFCVDILRATLLPFIQGVYPMGHRLMQDDDPKHTSVYGRSFSRRIVQIGGKLQPSLQI